jgi:hypothetical protein
MEKQKIQLNLEVPKTEELEKLVNEVYQSRSNLYDYLRSVGLFGVYGIEIEGELVETEKE